MRTIEHWMLYRVGSAVVRAYSAVGEARRVGEDPEEAARRVRELGLPVRELVSLSARSFDPRTVRQMPQLDHEEIVSFDGVPMRVLARDARRVYLEPA